MLPGVTPRLLWDDTRLVLHTTFAFAHFQWRALNTFFVTVTGLSMGGGRVAIGLPSENSYLEIL